jgi:hypothetical protein
MRGIYILFVAALAVAAYVFTPPAEYTDRLASIVETSVDNDMYDATTFSWEANSTEGEQ